MKIFKISRFGNPPIHGPFPCATLTSDTWNDYSFRTLYLLKWWKSRGNDEELGHVKIMQRGKKTTSLPVEFDRLSQDFCSLGQSLDYYEKVAALGHKWQEQLLASLRDAASNPAIANSFQTEEAFTKSLLRFSEAEKALKEATQVLTAAKPPQGNLAFEFSSRLPKATAAHTVTLTFDDNPAVPDRINAFIGKNGTGKTWLLSRLAAALSGDDISAGTFKGSRPSFGRVLAVSYSAFDRFRRPKGRVFSYRYCGMYDDSGNLLQRGQLFRKLKTTYAIISENNRHGIWRKAMSEVVGEVEVDKFEEYASANQEGSKRTRIRPGFSSGQLVLLATLSELIANIDQEALVLFDEPELHLHPNAIGGLMRYLDLILQKFNSFAIVATHSPLILQQIPAQYVRVFNRIGNTPYIQPLSIESFGENLTTLSEEVFQASASSSLFRDWAKENADTFEEDTFPFGLSFSAKTLLASMQSK